VIAALSFGRFRREETEIDETGGDAGGGGGRNDAFNVEFAALLGGLAFVEDQRRGANRG